MGVHYLVGVTRDNTYKGHKTRGLKMSLRLLLLSVLTVATLSTVTALKCWESAGVTTKAEKTCDTDVKYCWSFAYDTAETKMNMGCGPTTRGTTDAEMITYFKSSSAGLLESANQVDDGKCVKGKFKKNDPKMDGKICHCNTDLCNYSGASSLQMSGLLAVATVIAYLSA